MRSLKLFVLLTLSVVTSTIAVAQDGNETSRNILRELWGQDRQQFTVGNMIPSIQNENIKGSPFLFNDFTEGIVITRDNKQSNVMPMNFNVYDQEIVIRGERGYLAIQGDNLQGFRLITSDEIHEYIRGLDASDLKRDEYVRVMVKGEMALLYKPEVTIRGSESVASYGSTPEREFIFKERYYVQRDGEIERLRRLSRRHILRFFDDKRDLMESYAKSKELDLGEAEDVAKLIEYYNSVMDEDSGSA